MPLSLNFRVTTKYFYTFKPESMIMKKIIVLIISLIACYSITLAGNFKYLEDKPIGFGVKGGMVYSKLVPVNDLDGFSKWRFGTQLGGYARFSFHENFCAGIEILYSQYGGGDVLDTAIYTPSSSILNPLSHIQNIQFDVRIHTIEIPIMVMAKFPIAPEFKPFIYLGANMGINVNAETRIKREEVILDKTNTRYIYDNTTDRVKLSDFSPIAGLGVVSEMLGVKLSLDLRLKYGVYDINNVKGLPGFKNTGVILSFGIGL